MGCGLDGPGFESRQVQQIFFSSPKRPNLTWDSHIVLFSGYRCTFLGIKRPGHEVYHLPPTNVEVKNEWSCTSPPAIYLHEEDWDIFTFIYIYIYEFGGFYGVCCTADCLLDFDIRQVSRCPITNPHGVQTQKAIIRPACVLINLCH